MIRPALGLALAVLPLAGQQGRWRPEDRVVLRDFSRIQAVAASQAMVFGASDAGLIMRDHRFQRWLAPLTAVDGYPTERVYAAHAEPFGQTVWLGTARGLVSYEPMLGRFDRMDLVGGVQAIVSDPRDPAGGLWLANGGRWAHLPRGSFFPTPAAAPAGLRPLTLAELYRRYPAAEALGGQVLTDDRLRTHRFTGVARVHGAEEFWLGTTGMGLVQFDALIARFAPQPFGLLSDGVGALVPVPDGLWVATDGRGRRHGLAFLTADLERWRWDEGPRATGFGAGGFRAGLARGGALWLAGARGLWRVEPGRSHALIGTADGLPDEDVFALAQGPAGVWVGTARGLALVDDSGSVQVVAHGHTVLALQAARDTAWVGTLDGLGIAWPGADRIRVREDVLRVPELRGAVLALARTADTVVAVTPERIVWWGGGAGGWTVERPLIELGTLRAAAGDDGGVWIGGDRGVAWFHYATRAFRVVAAAVDLPGPVRALTVDRTYLWVGTDQGLVRFPRDLLLP